MADSHKTEHALRILYPLKNKIIGYKRFDIFSKVFNFKFVK